MKYKKILFTYILFGLLNIVSTKWLPLCLVTTILEYGVVLYYLISKQYSLALIYFISFTSLSLEMDAYIYLDGISTFPRYHFLNPPILGQLMYDALAVLISMLVYYSQRVKVTLKSDAGIFIKWAILLGVTGLLSVGICIALNDNGMVATGWYPKLSLSLFFKYIAFLCLIVSTYIVANSPDSRELLDKSMQTLLLGVTVVGILSVLLGFRGYYGSINTMMLAPLSIAYAPCLILFSGKQYLFGKVNFWIALILIVLAFSSPVVVGSKWYLIIALTFVFYIYHKFHFRSLSVLFICFALFLILVPWLSNIIMSTVEMSDFNSWKFNQTIGALNVFSYDSFQEWFLNLDDSAKFRIDEPINIIIEYIQKPMYSIFGKGFGGTIPQHTIFCNWDLPSSFTEDQRTYHLFYSMHESFAVLFLRHGIIGVAFFFIFICKLLNKWNDSPWVAPGLLWFLFYWSFGISFRFGVVALILALTTSYKEKKWQI